MDLPIALRRTRRRVSQVQSTQSTQSALATPPRTPATPATPKRRVRFSDPGTPRPPHRPDPQRASATGLTPLIRRTSLNLFLGGTPDVVEASFLPLRQVLDGRVKRRLRRHGLSEEMNLVYDEQRAEKRRHSTQKKRERELELEQLQAQLAHKDAEIARLRRAGMDHESRDERDECDECDDDMGGLDTHFGDATMAELQCSTPHRHAQNDPGFGPGSFPTPPATSPVWAPADFEPPTPTTPRVLFERESHESETYEVHETYEMHDVDVQASLPDPAADALRDELASLQRETVRLRSALASCQAIVERADQQFQSVGSVGSVGSDGSVGSLDDRVGRVLQALSDKTAVLHSLSASLASLGFGGDGDAADAADAVARLKAAFRAARLELEYLAPGESALPLAAPAAAVLDVVLVRLRALTRDARDAVAERDALQEATASLRQQLDARVSAMDALAGDVAERDELIAAKNALLADKEALLGTQAAAVADLEVGLDRLKGAVASYERDTRELEVLVQRLEGELRARTRDAAARDAGHGRTRAAVAVLQSELARVAQMAADLVAADGVDADAAGADGADGKNAAGAVNANAAGAPLGKRGDGRLDPVE